MAKRVDALVTPALLEWGRETAGYSREEAADKLGVSVERLRSWESGEARPTINQVRNVSRIYQRPIALFYLPEAPEIPRPPRDFRRLPGEVAGVESPELRLEVRRAEYRAEVAVDLGLTEPGAENPLLGEADLSDDPAAVGSRLRELLEVSLETQLGWRDQYQALNGWRAVLERQGVLVLQMTDVEMTEARGFSLSESAIPIVAANIKDFVRGRVFTLLHEATHLMLRAGGLCDLNDTAPREPQLLLVEQFCNAVAGAALVPEQSLLTSQVVKSHQKGEPSWTTDELNSLSHSFSVSQEVVLRRLLDLDLTTVELYAERREEFLEAYEEARRSKEASGFPMPHQTALASGGPTFAGLVMARYAEGQITASDVAEYLGLRLKHLPRLEDQLASLQSR